MATQMERAFQTMGLLEKGLIEWDKGLRRFLDSVSQQHGTLNHQWNDPRQELYNKSWTHFESALAENNKLAAEVYSTFIEFMKFMAIYLKRPGINTSEAFKHIKKVRSLSGWPASASTTIDLEKLFVYLEKYEKVLEDFKNELKAFTKNIIGPLQQIEQLVRSPKLDRIREQLKLRGLAWIEGTEKSIQNLKETIDTIIKELKPMI